MWPQDWLWVARQTQVSRLVNLDGDCANCLIIIESSWTAGLQLGVSPPFGLQPYSSLGTEHLAKGLTNSRRTIFFNSHPCWSGSWDVVHLLYLLVACGDPHLPSSQTIFLVLLPTILCSIYPWGLTLLWTLQRGVPSLCKHCSEWLEEPSLLWKGNSNITCSRRSLLSLHVFIWSIIHSSLDSFNKYWTPLLPGTMQCTENIM